MQRLKSLHRKNRYTQVSNDAIDQLPDLNSLGLLTTYLRHSDDYDFDLKAFLRAKSGIGEIAGYKARTTLIQYGYIVQIKVRHSYRGRFHTEIYRAAEPHTEADLAELVRRYSPGRRLTIPLEKDGEVFDKVVVIQWMEMTSWRGVEKFTTSSPRRKAAFSQVAPDLGFLGSGRSVPGSPDPGRPGSGEPGTKKKTREKTNIHPSIPSTPTRSTKAKKTDRRMDSSKEEKISTPKPTVDVDPATEPLWREAREVLTETVDWGRCRRPTAQQADQMASAVVAAVAQGWPLPQLTRYIRAAISEVINPNKAPRYVLGALTDHLPVAPPQQNRAVKGPRSLTGAAAAPQTNLLTPEQEKIAEEARKAACESLGRSRSSLALTTRGTMQAISRRMARKNTDIRTIIDALIAEIISSSGTAPTTSPQTSQAPHSGMRLQIGKSPIKEASSS